MKKYFFVFAAMLAVVCFFSSCETSSKGPAPKDVSGKSFTFSGCSRTIDFTSNSSGVIWVGNRGAAPKVRYVRYNKKSETEAVVEFSWYDTDKSKSNPYALDETASFVLTFATESAGVYGGAVDYQSWSYGKDQGKKRTNYSGKTFSVY